MDKIPFEDGTLVTAGYVEIDGTKHETVQPEYTGNTPLSAYNMNKMQDNIEDSINEEKLVKRINISGASKQDTREGDNLLNIEDYASTTGAIINSITSEVIDITSPTGLSYESTLYFENIKLEAGKTYTIQRIITTKSGTKSNSTGQIELYLGGTWKKVILGASSTKNTFTVDETSTYRTRLYVAPANTSDAFTITVSNFMIYEGTEIKEYEQYGVSPSIEYEAPIESVGDNINLFDKDNANKITGTYFNSTTTVLSAGETANTIYIKCDKNTEYSISKISSQRFAVAYSYEVPKLNVNLYDIVSVTTGTVVKLPKNSKAEYLLVFYYKSDSDTLTEQEILDSIKISKGTSTGAYSPYGQGSITVVNSNKNFINIKDGSWTENGLTVNVKDNVININGTVTSSSNVFFTLQEALKLNGNYSFQAGNNVALTGGEYFRLYTGTTGFEVLKAFGALTSLNTKSENINISGTADRLAIRVNEGTVFNNVTFKPQLEFGSTATEYVPHQSQTKALYTQQPFRAIGDVRDKFVKVDGVWYEEHYIKLDSLSELAQQGGGYIVSAAYASDTYFCGFLKSGVPDFKKNSNTVIMCDKLPIGLYSNITDKECINNAYQLNIRILASRLSENSADGLTEYITKNPIFVQYVLVEPILIPCTPEQVEVLNDIYSAYANGLTNIICNDEIEPVIEIVKESKETVQSENDKAISALLERVSQLEQLVASVQNTTVEEEA